MMDCHISSSYSSSNRTIWQQKCYIICNLSHHHQHSSLRSLQNQIASKTTQAFIITLVLPVALFLHFGLANSLESPEPTNLRVFQRTSHERNFNIGVIQVKLKNWTTSTRLPPIARSPARNGTTDFVAKRRGEANETATIRRQQLQKTMKRSNKNGGERQAAAIGGTGGGGKEAGREVGGGGETARGSGWPSADDMDGLFPYLLLALGIALVAFFIILYAILNALLQRKDARGGTEEEGRGAGDHREHRAGPKGEKRRKQRSGGGAAGHWMEQGGGDGEDDDEELEEDDELDTLSDEDGTPPPLRVGRQHHHYSKAAPTSSNTRKWHNRQREQRPRAAEFDANKEDIDNDDYPKPSRHFRMVSNSHSGGRSHSQQQQHGGYAHGPRVVHYPYSHQYIPVPPPPRERPPPRPGQQTTAAGRAQRRRVEWMDEEDGFGGLPPLYPPPPPRVRPPPPPLPGRYQRRRPKAPDPERDSGDPDSESLLNRHPQMVHRENTDSTLSSVQRGRTGSL